jgi:transposase-like protein
MVARKLLLDQPEASLREIARRAGISPSTVHDVRKRLRNETGRDKPAWSQGRAQTPAQAPAPGSGSAPASAKQESAGQPNPAPPRAEPTEMDAAATLRALRIDPSVRLTASGRTLLRLLDVHSLDRIAWQRLAETVPAHCNSMVAEAARQCAEIWQTFARDLEKRSHASE